MKFRALVQAYLRKKLTDPGGTLEVNDDGPHWRGDAKIKLSYAHTEDKAILVYSFSHTLGVDAEKKTRKFMQDPLLLATRFFNENEVAELKKLSAEDFRPHFVELWVKKEAYAKWSRLGLAKTLAHDLSAVTECKILPLPLVPEGYLAAIALHENQAL
jgi:hypothetical protein